MKCRKAFIVYGEGAAGLAKTIAAVLECIGVRATLWVHPAGRDTLILQLCGARYAGTKILAALAWLYGRRVVECLEAVGERGLAERLVSVAAAGAALKQVAYRHYESRLDAEHEQNGGHGDAVHEHREA